MRKPKPLIKDNNGKPIALCNRCFLILCYVSNITSEEETPKVIERLGDGNEDYISTPIGETPPPYCKKCSELLLNFILNE